MDQDKIRKILKIYRGSERIGKGVQECRKLKFFIDDRIGQTDAILDAAEFANRVDRKEVRSEDVRVVARSAANHIPDILNVVAGHIRRSNAKT